MPHFGPPLAPYPTNVSVWTWLFGSTNDISDSTVEPSNERGFRDAGTGDFLSFWDLRNKAIWLSAALARSRGLHAHQTVAIICSNSIWYPLAMLSANRLGAAVTTLPNEATAEDLAYFLRASNAKIVYANLATLDEVHKACKMVGLADDRLILLEGSRQGHTNVQDLVDYGRSLNSTRGVQEWEPTKDDPPSCAFLSFTSGTTGRPKAVMISHTNIIAQLCQVRQLTPPDRCRTVLGILPFYHITGLVHLLHLPIVLGYDMVVMAKFNMREMMDTIVRYHCNELWLVPPLLIRLLNDPVAQEYDLSFIAQFNTGAAPLAEEVIAKLSARFPHVVIRQAWGMTESTSCLTLTPAHLCSWENAAKVGKIVPGTEIRIVDPSTGDEVGAGHSGEIWARGPQVSMGYLNNPAATAETYGEEGYLRTGDLGAIDVDGFITIHDRIKELIKVRGHGIAPAELEDLLHGHPRVSDAAVVGIPDTYSGELPRAFVVLRSGVPQCSKTEKELQEYVKSRKARHKWLAGGIEFVDSIPKSSSGKILRRVLKGQWKEMGEAEKQKRAKL